MATPDHAAGDYEVGYGKPPKHTRFKPGQSGNPKGAKKGSRSLKSDLDAALKATHTITLGGKKRKDTTQALAMLTLAVRAASGDLRAQRLLADLVLQVFGAGDRAGEEARLSAQDQLLLDQVLRRVEGALDEDEAAIGPNAKSGPHEAALNADEAHGGEKDDG